MISSFEPIQKYIFLMRQALIRDHFGAEILYNFFEHLNRQMKKLKLESCRSRRDLQFLYKNYLHQMSY
jgi:hypothetical protein